MNDLNAKRKELFEKERKRLCEKHPGKAELINRRIDEVMSDGCSGCKSRRLMVDLLNTLGEPIPQAPQMNRSMNMAVPPNVMAMQSGSPRPPCEDCFKEHVGKAVVLLTESKLGYPEHRWLAIANLGEASAEILGISEELANEVRGIKIRMVQDPSFMPDLMKYLK